MLEVFCEKTVKAFNNFVPSYDLPKLDERIVPNHNDEINLSALNIPTLPKSIVDEIQDSAKLLVGKGHKYNEDVFYVPNKDNENHPRKVLFIPSTCKFICDSKNCKRFVSFKICAH